MVPVGFVASGQHRSHGGLDIANYVKSGFELFATAFPLMRDVKLFPDGFRVVIEVHRRRIATFSIFRCDVLGDGRGDDGCSPRHGGGELKKELVGFGKG